MARPAKVEAYRERVAGLLGTHKPKEILAAMRAAGYDGGNGALYSLIASMRCAAPRPAVRFGRLKDRLASNMRVDEITFQFIEQLEAAGLDEGEFRAVVQNLCGLVEGAALAAEEVVPEAPKVPPPAPPKRKQGRPPKPTIKPGRRPRKLKPARLREEPPEPEVEEPEPEPVLEPPPPLTRVVEPAIVAAAPEPKPEEPKASCPTPATLEAMRDEIVAWNKTRDRPFFNSLSYARAHGYDPDIIAAMFQNAAKRGLIVNTRGRFTLPVVLSTATGSP